MSEANTGRAIGWEDEIENDGTQWVLLPEGDYRFQVESFERAHTSRFRKASVMS